MRGSRSGSSSCVKQKGGNGTLEDRCGAEVLTKNGRTVSSKQHATKNSKPILFYFSLLFQPLPLPSDCPASRCNDDSKF